ncbi:MAG: hypothetical protein P8077_06350 [Gammaproteobacteria bacterium]
MSSFSKAGADSDQFLADAMASQQVNSTGVSKNVIPKVKSKEALITKGSKSVMHAVVGAVVMATLSSGLLLGMVSETQADVMDQARRIHQRLTGVSPSPTVLDSMITKINANDAVGAAFEAMSNPNFCNVMLKNWITPWTNEEFDPTFPLNDYVATVIGIIRAQLENDGVDLCDPTQLIQTTQSGLPGSVVPASATAGVLTTRQAAAAFFSGGTNRLMWRKTAIHYLCRDMEDLKDFSRPSDRVRQDVSRSPGGDSTAFRQHCVGCHSGMDAVTGAFAYFSFDEEAGRLVYTPNQVQEKYLINEDSFPLGYITTDDGWMNYWREGRFSVLGWDTSLPGAGSGPKSLGQEVAASRGFATCQIQKVFEKVCYRPPETAADMAEVEQLANSFQQNYSMKSMMAETAAYCRGD